MATDTDGLIGGESGRERDRERTGNPVVNWMEGLSEAAYAYLLLLPAFALLTLIAFYPMLRTFVMSLRANQTRGLDPSGGSSASKTTSTSSPGTRDWPGSSSTSD